jgi:hypothetical protein
VEEGRDEETGKCSVLSQATPPRRWVNPASSYLAQASTAHHRLYSQQVRIATEFVAGLSQFSRRHIRQSLHESWPLHPHLYRSHCSTLSGPPFRQHHRPRKHLQYQLGQHRHSQDCLTRFRRGFEARPRLFQMKTHALIPQRPRQKPHFLRTRFTTSTLFRNIIAGYV